MNLDLRGTLSGVPQASFFFIFQSFYVHAYVPENCSLHLGGD